MFDLFGLFCGGDAYSLKTPREARGILIFPIRAFMQSALIRVNNNSSKKKGLLLWKRTSWVRSGSAGFTLIELLVAMAIVMVLATLGVSLYSNFVDKARETSVIVYLRYINKAELEYQFSNDKYTGSFDDLENTASMPKGPGNNIKKLGKEQRIMERYSINLKGNGNNWNARAEPVDKSTDLRWFYIDETEVTRFETGKKANAGSPPL